MLIVHLALGGCISAPPLPYGITPDTGGHIAYILNAAIAQSQIDSVSNVTIVTRLFNDASLGSDYALPIQSIAPNIGIRRLAITQRNYLPKEAISSLVPELCAEFIRYLGQLQTLPAVIHAHFADEALIAGAARERFGVPFVYTPHSLGAVKSKTLDVSESIAQRVSAEHKAIQSADAIIVSTQDEADRQIGEYGVAGLALRVERLSPGVPVHATQGITEREPSWLRGLLDNIDKPIVLAIARPVRRKNLTGLVRAFASTPGLAEIANLVILAGHAVGTQSAEEISVRGELSVLCATAALQGRVAMPSTHRPTDVHTLYAMAAQGGVFVNPALHEPFGLTLIEAAAMGVPVVATQHGGPAEILHDIGHGLLVDPEDDTAIGSACLRLLSDSSLHARLAKAGMAGACHYSWARYAARSVAIYESLRRPPRLLISDLDDTLTGCRDGARAFSRWHAKSGLHFTVATGRSVAMACAILDEWRLPKPDALIVDVGTRVMLPRPEGGWRECPEYATAIGRDWDRTAISKLLATLRLCPQPIDTAGPHKLSFFGTAADAASIRTVLADAGLRALVIHSHGRLIDVIAPHAGKAAAVAFYAARLGLSFADCLAAGDSGNDLDMLTACGRAIVVGNASPDLASLSHRYGLFRATSRYAAGVMEGLTAFGLTGDARDVAAA